MPASAINCLAAKCHRLEEAICSSLNVPLNTVTDCALWHGMEGFIEVKGQKFIIDPYAYLGNYPDSVISFRENGIYINKSFTNLWAYCKNSFPPMCWKNFKRYNQHLYDSVETMKDVYENTDVYIAPDKTGFYDAGKFIRLDNITIEDFLERYLHFIDYKFPPALSTKKAAG